MTSFLSKITEKVRNRTENGQKSTENQFFWNFFEIFLIGFGNGFDIELYDFFQTIFPNIC